VVVGVPVVIIVVCLALLFSYLDNDDDVYLNISNCGLVVTAAVIFHSSNTQKERVDY